MVRYLCFCQMTPTFLQLPLEERKKWIPKWSELAAKHGLKVIFWGSALGVSEHVAIAFESKEYSDNFMKFLREWQSLGTPEAKKYIENTRTITVF